MWTRFRARFAVATALVGALFMAIAASTGSAATTNNLGVVDFWYGDRIANYSFDSTSYNYNKVDWGINLVFFGNAEVDKIKNRMNTLPAPYNGPGDGYSFNPGTAHLAEKYSRQRDSGTSYFWDIDSGRKNRNTWFSHGYHYRVWAKPGVDRNWNPQYGYYVVGETHQDYKEGIPAIWWSGLTEYAEQWFRDRARAEFGVARVYPNWVQMFNYRCCFNEGGHHKWQQNATAMLIDTP